MTSPPTISPQQMNILRAVTSMAWADGVLEPAEIEVMSTQLAARFAPDPSQQPALSQQIQDYFNQRIPLAEVLPKITQENDRRLILKLGYLVIAASARTPDEPRVNLEEQAAFRSLVEQLALPASVVQAVSAEIQSDPADTSVDPLTALVQGFSSHYGS